MFFSALLRPPLDDDGWKRAEPAYEPDRTFGVHAGDALVGTATSFPCRMAVPGGAVFDSNALQTGVTKILTEDYGLANVSGVNCAQNIKVTQGATFTCSANVDGKPVTVPVRVTSSAGDYEVGRPT